MSLFSTITDKLKGKAEDFIFSKFTEIIEDMKLKDKFKSASRDYFDKIFENCDLSGEFDFEAVETYLLNNFDNKIVAIFYDIKNIGSKGRDSLREDVLRGAVERGNGNEKAIRKYCNVIIDFVGACLHDKISDSDKQLTHEITAVTNEYYKHLVNEMGELKDIELKILNEIRYFGSFAEQIDNLGLPKVITTNKFSFANSNIGFYGRYDEQKEIEKFMSDNRPLLFWSVTGRGGVGKSKFALHICKKYEYENWKAAWLNKDKIEDINKVARNDGYNKPLLFVCDYAGEYIETIKTLLLKLSINTQYKIRVLMLERSGYNQISNSDYFTYSDVWYNRFLSGHNSDEIKEMEYSIDSLNLDNYGLNDEDMFSILDDFSNGKLSANNKKDIVDFIKNRLDRIPNKDVSSHSEERCLFLLFTADAFLHGNCYKDWDTELLIKNYIKRFEDNLKAHYSEDICERAYIILAVASAIGTINIESVNDESIFNYYVNPIKERLNYNISINKLKTFLSVLCEKDTVDLNIYPMIPDLVGEFFFINMFNYVSTDYKREFYKIFCSEKYRGYFSSFLIRCLDDWNSLENFQKIIKDLFEFAIEYNYNGFIEECVNNSFFKDLSFCYRLTENDFIWLKKVLIANKSEKYYIEYSHVLASSAIKMSESSSIIFIANKIKNEILSFCNTATIAGYYTVTLASAAQKMNNINDILVIANMIKKEILSTYNDTEIAWHYAMILVSASSRMSSSYDKLIIANRIHNEILRSYNTIDIAIQYARSLFYVTREISNAYETMIIANRIKDEVLSIYSDVKIAEVYVAALTNVITRTPYVFEKLYILDKIKKILIKYNSKDIAKIYGVALAYLYIICGLESLFEEIENIRRTYDI